MRAFQHVEHQPALQLQLESLKLRPMQAADLAFSQLVYADSRATEMAQVTQWDATEKAQFLSFQFGAQHQHYQQHFPKADYCIITLDSAGEAAAGEDIGRLYVDRGEQEIRLMDIALLTAVRGQGIGSHFIAELIAEASATGKCISLHVEAENPARRLYQRLGFVETGEESFYKRMHWYPHARSSAS